MELIPIYEGGERLFYNENLFLPSTYYEELIKVVEMNLIRFYPTPWADRLVEALSSFLNVDEGSVLPGAGADDVLRMLISGAERVGIVEPAYSMYEHLARSMGKEVRSSVYPDIDPLAGCDLIIVNTPNNPTGLSYSRGFVEELRSIGYVVVDEAYVEFSGSEGFLRDVDETLTVVRTFSKAWGLAGLRVGYAISSEEVVTRAKGRSLPYQVSAPSEAMAIRALEMSDLVHESVKEVERVRERLTGRLRAMGFEVPDSSTNFVFIESLGREAWERLRARGFEVRLVDRPGARGIRITLAPWEVMDGLLEELEVIP